MKILQVPSFQTTDQKLHATRADALTHQAQIDIRAMLQSSNHLGGPNLTPGQTAEFIIKNADKVAGLLREYREKMRRAAGSKKEA